MLYVILAIVIFIGLGFLQMKNEQKEKRQYFQNNGGVRILFEPVVKFFEEDLGMRLSFDSGDSFAYEQEILTKDLKKVRFLFFINSQYNNFYLDSKKVYEDGSIIEGVRVGPLNQNVSIEFFKTNFITNSVRDILSEDYKYVVELFKWQQKYNDFPSHKLQGFELFVTNFYIFDNLDVNLVMKNIHAIYQTREFYLAEEENSHTPSLSDYIFMIPPALQVFFVVGYPDVCVWLADNLNENGLKKYESIKNIEADSERFIEPEGHFSLFALNCFIIDYKKNVNTKLECAYSPPD